MPADGARTILRSGIPGFARLNEPPEQPAATVEPFPRLALQLYRRRWPLYLGLSAALCGLMLGVQRYVHVPHAIVVGELLLSPLFDAASIVVAARDADYLRESAWGRLLDRAWAVIILEFLIAMAHAFSESALRAPGSAWVFMGTALLTFVALLIYAPVDACLEDGLSPLTIVPNALGHSLVLSWRRISRAFGLFAIILGVELVEQLSALGLILKHVPWADFWATVPFDSLATVAISVIVTAAYVDLRRSPA